jgi:hypothetical protein
MVVNSVQNSSYTLRKAAGASYGSNVSTTYQLQLPRVSRIKNTYYVLYALTYWYSLSKMAYGAVGSLLSA